MLMIQVKWRDAKLDPSPSGDFTLDNGPNTFGKTPICEDLGYLVRWDAKELILAVSRCPEDNDYRHYNAIPTKMIVDIDVLTPKPTENTP